jgi:hypothetical protein
MSEQQKKRFPLNIWISAMIGMILVPSTLFVALRRAEKRAEIQPLSEENLELNALMIKWNKQIMQFGNYRKIKRFKNKIRLQYYMLKRKMLLITPDSLDMLIWLSLLVNSKTSLLQSNGRSDKQLVAALKKEYGLFAIPMQNASKPDCSLHEALVNEFVELNRDCFD